MGVKPDGPNSMSQTNAGPFSVQLKSAFVAVMFDAVNWDGSKHTGGDEDLIVGEEKQKPHSHP